MRIASGLLLTLFLTHCSAVEQRTDLRAEYYKARALLVSRKDDAPGLGVALDRSWSALADWTAGYLDAHPDVTAEQLAKAVVALDPPRRCADNDAHCFNEYPLSATAVRFECPPETSFVVAANYPKSGTFFVVARANDGHFYAMWNIKDVARRHYAARDEIGYWAWTGSGWGDGPATGRVGPLPRAASGKPRFYIDAVAAAEAGGTFRSQFSVWEWSGAEARPLFIESYHVSFDTEPVTVKGGDVSIPMKGSYKSAFTCGMCPEPRVLRSLRVTGDGVHDLGAVDDQPALRCVDDLWDRLIHGQDAGGGAAPEVVAALRPVVEKVKRSAGADLDYSLGLLEDTKVTDEKGHRFIVVSSDALDCRQLRFEIGSRTCLESLHVLDTCGD